MTPAVVVVAAVGPTGEPEWEREIAQGGQSRLEALRLPVGRSPALETGRLSAELAAENFAGLAINGWQHPERPAMAEVVVLNWQALPLAEIFQSGTQDCLTPQGVVGPVP